MEEEDEDESVPLIDVFNIIYQDIRELGPEKQCGVIKICSDSGVQYVYKVDRPPEEEDMRPPLRFGDHIPVTLKVPTSSGWEIIDFKYDLFGGAYRGSKALEWEPQSPRDAFMREMRLQSCNGIGDIVVTMGFYADATVAELEVKVLDDNSATREVYGVMGATNSELDIPICMSLLFVKMPDNPIQLGDKGDVIPLSKSRVAVPMKSELYVDINLNYNGVDHTGSLSFDAQKQGESIKFIDDVIQVKVNWFADENKICSMYDKQPKIDDDDQGMRSSA